MKYLITVCAECKLFNQHIELPKLRQNDWVMVKKNSACVKTTNCKWVLTFFFILEFDPLGSFEYSSISNLLGIFYMSVW